MENGEFGVADYFSNDSAPWGWPELVFTNGYPMLYIRKIMGITGVIQGILQPLGTPLKLCIKMVHSAVAEITPVLETSIL